MTTSSPRSASRHFFSWIFLFSILISLGTTPLGANDNSGKNEKPYALLFGTVWGPDSRPVYGVRILIRRSDKKKAQWELYSDHRGEFAQRVPAGKADYIVWADLKGNKALEQAKLGPGDPVTTHVEYDERVDFGVHLK